MSSSTRQSTQYTSSTDPKPRLLPITAQDRDEMRKTLKEASVFRGLPEDDENIWPDGPTSAFDSTRPYKEFTTSKDPKPSLAPTCEEYRAT
jgi:hypothetical protein